MPKIEEGNGLAKFYPAVFSSCVVTHAVAKGRRALALKMSKFAPCWISLRRDTDSDISSEATSSVGESKHVIADGEDGDHTSVGLKDSFLKLTLTLS